MPTHREYQPGFVPSLDLARLADELGPDVTLLVRGHYFYGGSAHVAELRRRGIVDVSGHSRVEELYLAADALITDYSSAMFDYAVLDRPVIIYAPDWDIYSAVRGTYFNLLQEAPGAVAHLAGRADPPARLGRVPRAGRDRAPRRLPPPVLRVRRRTCRRARGAPRLPRRDGAG
ncbi:hypothetical protein SCANM63S_09494 [Streptomyces canarius]